LKHRRRYNEDD